MCVPELFQEAMDETACTSSKQFIHIWFHSALFTLKGGNNLYSAARKDLFAFLTDMLGKLLA